MTAEATPPPDPAVLRARAGELLELAGAADGAAARFGARIVTGARESEVEAIGLALGQIARAHRAAAAALVAYASVLEDAAQRRLALDELVEVARHAPGSDLRMFRHVRGLRDELVARLDDRMGDASARCAEALRYATPTHAAAGGVANAIALALGHARAHLLEVAGPDPRFGPALPSLPSR